ncbi:MAG: GNAT family N-acetyltransferase [Candidatus Methanoperedens sp.]|nr:GNAT family N-acetyltransferase [Candidatus Methanoperedens sp.]MCE8427639.1 GNAT family N-acetyltransferase [Candidatus Methanoperedens sp.]
MDTNIRKADSADINDIKKILSYYFLDTDNVGININQFIVAVLYGKTIGCACLDIGDIVELRSIAVLPAYRNSGTGSKLVDFLLDHAMAMRDAIYLRTMTPGFFEKKGFKKLPDEKKITIWKDCAQCDRFNICRQTLMKIMLH